MSKLKPSQLAQAILDGIEREARGSNELVSNADHIAGLKSMVRYLTIELAIDKMDKNCEVDPDKLFAYNTYMKTILNQPTDEKTN